MAKFHVNPENGNVGVCRAQHHCPLGGEDIHGDSVEEAAAAYEAKMNADSTFTPLQGLQKKPGVAKEKKLSQVSLEDLSQKASSLQEAKQRLQGFKNSTYSTVTVGQMQEAEEEVARAQAAWRATVERADKATLQNYENEMKNRKEFAEAHRAYQQAKARLLDTSGIYRGPEPDLAALARARDEAALKVGASSTEVLEAREAFHQATENLNYNLKQVEANRRQLAMLADQSDNSKASVLQQAVYWQKIERSYDHALANLATMQESPSGLYKVTDYPEAEGLAKAKAEAEVKQLELTIEGKRRPLFNRELRPLQLKLEEAQQRLQSLS